MPHPSTEGGEILDVLIVGAGLSGIGAAWHLQQKCAGKSYAILEGRAASGGTWGGCVFDAEAILARLRADA